MRSNVHNFPAPGRKIQKSNAGPESIAPNADEKLVLKAYATGSVDIGPQT